MFVLRVFIQWIKALFGAPVPQERVRRHSTTKAHQRHSGARMRHGRQRR